MSYGEDDWRIRSETITTDELESRGWKMCEDGWSNDVLGMERMFRWQVAMIESYRDAAEAGLL